MPAAEVQRVKQTYYNVKEKARIKSKRGVGETERKKRQPKYSGCLSSTFPVKTSYILTNASFGALHTGHAQSSGRSSNFFPSLASSYSYPHTVHLHIIISFEFELFYNVRSASRVIRPSRSQRLALGLLSIELLVILDHLLRELPAEFIAFLVVVRARMV